MRAFGKAALGLVGVVALGITVSSQLGGGGMSLVYTSGGIATGSGTIANPVVVTYSAGSTIAGTGSAGDPYRVSASEDGGWFGDGSDGDVTIAGVVTLTRDMYYDHLIVNGELYVDCFRVVAKTSIENNGLIADRVLIGGKNASGSTSGTPGCGSTHKTLLKGCSANLCGAAGILPGTVSGGDGGGCPSVSGVAVGPVCVGTATATLQRFESLYSMVTARYMDNTGPAGTSNVLGPIGGIGLTQSGTAPENVVCSGGGGFGAGGGEVLVMAPVITGAGEVWSKGGEGGNAPAGAGFKSCGGGGGGAGGLVTVVISTGSFPTTSVLGGHGGTPLGLACTAGETIADSGITRSFRIGVQP